MPLTRRALLGAPLAAAAAAKPRPNIIFLFSDDHHFQCLGANGNPNIRTPHLDRLAAEGVNFTNAIISTSQCCPSRGIVLSGLETFQSGLISNGQTSFRPGIGPSVVEQLRTSGYQTTLVGKWHIRPEPGVTGFSNAPLWLRGGGSPYRDPKLRRGLNGGDQTVNGHITDLFTDAAIQSIQSARAPHLLWLAYNAPHTPWHAGPEYLAHYQGKTEAELAPPLHPKGGSKFDWATYYGVITHLDAAVGRLVQAVKSAGQWDNTAIFFMGDNGYMSGTRKWNGKVRHWDESVRIPFLAAGGLVKKSGNVSSPVASIDLPATWLDLARVKPAYPLAGRSVASYLRTGRGKHQAAFSVWDDGRPEGLAVKVPVEPYRLVRT
ncbi:MAG: sulfatase-like hydrolase/transferase, partial [Bryobacteraceae bacterium]|nr:sulfatase-like hydrolase/transferase [Bryobacteraceae bacterium]